MMFRRSPTACAFVILHSARFGRFCHHQLRLAFDYTPGHHDDQGQPAAGRAPADRRSHAGNGRQPGALGSFMSRR